VSGPGPSALPSRLVCIVVFLLTSKVSVYVIHTHTQPFYGPFSGTTWVSQCQKKSSSGLCDAREGRYTNIQAGCYSIQTNQRPTFLIPPFCATCPSCCNPPNLSWLDRHQICCLAYPVAWFVIQSWKFALDKTLTVQALHLICTINSSVSNTHFLLSLVLLAGTCSVSPLWSLESIIKGALYA